MNPTEPMLHLFENRSCLNCAEWRKTKTNTFTGGFKTVAYGRCTVTYGHFQVDLVDHAHGDATFKNADVEAQAETPHDFACQYWTPAEGAYPLEKETRQ